MGFVYLVVRVLAGCWLAWSGAGRLSPYERPAIVAVTGENPFVAVLTGLAAVIGGAFIATGIAVEIGVLLALLFLFQSSRTARRKRRAGPQFAVSALPQRASGDSPRDAAGIRRAA